MRKRVNELITSGYALTDVFGCEIGCSIAADEEADNFFQLLFEKPLLRDTRPSFNARSFRSPRRKGLRCSKSLRNCTRKPGAVAPDADFSEFVTPESVTPEIAPPETVLPESVTSEIAPPETAFLSLSLLRLFLLKQFLLHLLLFLKLFPLPFPFLLPTAS